ncbi:MAG: glycoside hydrolase family 16 protein [Verrucomicrobiota bacterium]
MKNSRLLHLAAVAVLPWLAPATAQAQTVLLRDDFSGSTLNTANWNLGTWMLGQTQLGNSPVITSGMARLTFDTYRFRGTEIWSKATFNRGNGLELEARVRLNNLPSGLVTSIFTYVYNNATQRSDELDIEILSKQVNASGGGDPVLFTTWNDWYEPTGLYQNGINHWSFSQFFPNFDVNQWHIYVIRWLPAVPPSLPARTEWLIDGVLVASSDKAQPDLATPVRFNFWAPASSWTDAYSSTLKPARKASGNVRYFYDIDHVEVRQLP